MAQTTIQGSFLGDGTVTGVKIGADFISAQTALAAPDLVSTDEILVSDAGVIKRMDISVLEIAGTQVTSGLVADARIAATLSRITATETLSSKSIDLGTNTLTGSVAEFNAALQSESFATLGGTETLVAKTLSTPTINAGTLNLMTVLTVANDIDVGAYEVRALKFESDQATGTAPLTVASTTVVTNLNADLLDGVQGALYSQIAATETLAAKTLTTPTIASTGWTNALHAHAANNSGGTLDASVLGAGTLPAARIAADSIVEAKLDVSNGPTNGQFLQAQSGEGGGLTWAAAGGALQSTIVGGSQLASGILLYSHNDAPTTTTITGAGFTPTSAIIFYGNQHTEYAGIGIADDANVDANWARNALKWLVGGSFIVMDNNGTNAMVANLTSLDSANNGGCTLSWLKYGNGITVDFKILFLR